MTFDPLVILVVFLGCLVVVQTERHHREQRRSEELRVMLNELVAKISEDPTLKFVTEAYYRSLREAGRKFSRPAPLPPSQGDRP